MWFNIDAPVYNFDQYLRKEHDYIPKININLTRYILIQTLSCFIIPLNKFMC